MARARAALRAAAKSSTQTKSNTRAPNERAISIVRSLLPVSRTTISSKRPRTDSRQLGRFSSSSLTIIVRETRARSSFGDRERWAGAARGESGWKIRCDGPVSGLGPEPLDLVRRLLGPAGEGFQWYPHSWWRRVTPLGCEPGRVLVEQVDSASIPLPTNVRLPKW